MVSPAASICFIFANRRSLVSTFFADVNHRTNSFLCVYARPSSRLQRLTPRPFLISEGNLIVRGTGSGSRTKRAVSPTPIPAPARIMAFTQKQYLPAIRPTVVRNGIPLTLPLTGTFPFPQTLLISKGTSTKGTLPYFPPGPSLALNVLVCEPMTTSFVLSGQSGCPRFIRRTYNGSGTL